MDLLEKISLGGDLILGGPLDSAYLTRASSRLKRLTRKPLGREERTSGVDIKAEDEEFVLQAKDFTSRRGSKAVLLLVGSRAAGLADSWSDIDMWVVGDKTTLSPSERERYEADEELFIDRGDYEAHWKFFDLGDLQLLLQGYPDEKMWILLTSQTIFGDESAAAVLKEQCRQYPREAVEPKLKLHFGRYWGSLGPLNTAARGMPETAFVFAGKAIEHLCKICCLAESKPFPYGKWLFSVSRNTVLGKKITPFITEAVFGIDEFLHPPKGKHFRELTPLKNLRDTKEIVREGLKELGWTSSWIENTDEAITEALKEPNNRLEATR